MPTIKGPIHFTGGFNAASFLADKASEIKVKLPFTAKGWKSSKTPSIADMTGIETTREQPKKRPVTVPETKKNKSKDDSLKVAPKEEPKKKVDKKK